MSLYSKLRSAIYNPREVILYIILGQIDYNKLKLEIHSIQQYLQIEPQSPLEMIILKRTDINEYIITLYILIKHFKLSTILELGVRSGESTIALLSAAKEISGEFGDELCQRGYG